MSFNPPKVDEWQWLDESCGLWFPWYTVGALEEISKWDLTGKIILEYGGGKSSLWWAEKAREVYTVERRVEWRFDFTIGQKRPFVTLMVHANEGIDDNKNAYINNIFDYIPFRRPDIVVVDDIFRYECIQKALTLPRPLTLIVDNWQQDQVFICPAAEELMKEFEGQFFIQPDHTNHSGRPWCTAIWHLK